MAGAAGCCRCAHSRRASPLACAGAAALVAAYTLLGAWLFLSLEGRPAAGGGRGAVAASRPAPAPAAALRDRTVDRLWAITEDLNILYKENWTKLAAKELLDFQRVLLQVARSPPSDRDRSRERDRDHEYEDQQYRWTFSSSFLYALTLITTIGHGNVAPRSAAGKAAAVAYACVGIPIIMLYLATLGEALARRLRALYARARPPPPPAPPDKPSSPFTATLNLSALRPPRAAPCRAHARVPAPLGVLLIAAYVGLGALLFRATEKWSLLDGCYFSFSSLATIGFGELRPGAHASTVSPRAEDLAVAVCCAYILIGIVVVAMCFNLIQEEVGAMLLAAAAGCARPPRVHSAERRDEPP